MPKHTKVIHKSCKKTGKSCKYDAKPQECRTTCKNHEKVIQQSMQKTQESQTQIMQKPEENRSKNATTAGQSYTQACKKTQESHTTNVQKPEQSLTQIMQTHKKVIHKSCKTTRK